MASKKRFSYQWRIFLPIFICIWAVILGMYHWHTSGVRDVRNEMAFDQLDVVGDRIADAFARGDTTGIHNFAMFLNKFYLVSENYDPMITWVIDTQTDSVEQRYGETIKDNFPLPVDKKGRVTIPRRYLNTDTIGDIDFIYSTYITPSKDKLVYVMLPYTKRLNQMATSRATYFWLMCVVIGIFVTIIVYITIAYFTRNLRMLRDFSQKASNDPHFMPPGDMDFPGDEIGDITREILNIYSLRMRDFEKSEREHQIALNAIEDKNRLKRELTSNINHELKTPVGVIKSYIDTLIDSPEMDVDTQYNFMLKIQNNVNRLTSLIQDITAITKLESGGKLVNLSEMNFHDFVFSFENYLKEGKILEGKLTFDFDMPIKCMIIGNESLLHTVLLNLVKNSVRYSEGTKCELLLTREDDDFFYFKFYDNGVGVSPENLPHMFERFYRVNQGRSRNAGGTGLGLSIVKVTIESLGGKIDVLNHFPSGLEFNFSLPKFKQKKGFKRPTVESKPQN